MKTRPTKTRSLASTGGTPNWTRIAQRKGLKVTLVMTDANGGTQSIKVPWTQVENLGLNVKPFARHVTTAFGENAA